MSELGEALARTRAHGHYSQKDVGAALGVSRVMVSHWESGERTPNDRQLSALARLYGVEPAVLIADSYVGPVADDLANTLLQQQGDAGSEVVLGVREFVRFLGRFAQLTKVLGEPLRSLRQSPFAGRQTHTHKDDVRRKAAEVRAYLGLGMAPIVDLDTVCEMLGIVAYRASLGPDPRTAPSGAFLRHPDAGLSILTNLDLTHAERRFAVARSLAHALFHSDETNHVLCGGGGRREAFADAFAGELLMPSDGVRRFVEAVGLPHRMDDPLDITQVQHYYGVSRAATLQRLRQLNAITRGTHDELQEAEPPASSAAVLGYSAAREAGADEPVTERLRRFPRSFLRMLRQAVRTGTISPPTAASFAGLAIPDITRILGQHASLDEDD